MTDFPYFTGTSGVHTAYTRCAYACVALALSVTPVWASGWDDFVRVCLAPAEAFEPYETTLPEVDPVPGWVETAEGEVVFALDTPTRFAVIETQPLDGRRACRVHDRDGAAASGFEAWFSAEAERGRYVADPSVTQPGAVGWTSNLIFEPVLSAQMWREGEAAVLRILETGLEA